nr:MAG: hypothetical protein DIU57_13795 [Pseudomonadota bacterium]
MFRDSAQPSLRATIPTDGSVAPKQIAEYRKALGISSHKLEASIDPSMKIYPGYMNERALREAVAEARDA